MIDRHPQWPPALVLTLIAIATLWPQAETGQPRLFIWCLTCNGPHTLDVLYNVVGFLPLGAALVSSGWSLGAAVAIGAGSSALIELLQYAVIPGRYAELRDVVANTIGCATGALLIHRLRVWLRPSGSIARACLVAWMFALAAIVIATAWWLRPDVPAGDIFGQRSPVRDWAPRFTGTIEDVRLGPLTVPNDRVADQASFRTELERDPAVLVVKARSGAPPHDGHAAMAALVASVDDVLGISQTHRGVLLGVRSSGTPHGLQNLRLELPVALRAGDELQASSEAGRKAIALRVRTPAGEHSLMLRLTAGAGWILLLPNELPVGPWFPLGSTLWLIALALPLGFYAQASSAGARTPLILGAIVIAGLAIIFGWLPRRFGLAEMNAVEWLAAVLGSALGAWLARLTTSRNRSRV